MKMSEERTEAMDTLYIPANIKTRFEFFDGFGFRELAVTAFVTAISIIAAILCNSLTNDIYTSILIVLITATASGMAVKKNEINQSVVDMMKLFIRFANTQQKYKYNYARKYRKEE